MTISREDVDRGKVDFSEVASGRRLPEVHPGQILRAEFLEPLGLSIGGLADAAGVSRSRISAVVNGRSSITTDTAMRLARFFGTTEEFWLNLQARYNLRRAGRKLRRAVERQVVPRTA